MQVLADVDLRDGRLGRGWLWPSKELPNELDIFSKELSPSLDLHKLADFAAATEDAISQAARVLHAEWRLVVLALAEQPAISLRPVGKKIEVPYIGKGPPRNLG